MSEVWTTKDGREIPIIAMSDKHLRNSYRMLRRDEFVGPKEVEAFMCYPPPNGDMAQMCYDQEFEALLMSPVSEFIDVFEDEAKRRGIEL